MRHFALNILKQDPNRKLGIANSRKPAGWDHDYLLSLLTGVDSFAATYDERFKTKPPAAAMAEISC